MHPILETLLANAVVAGLLAVVVYGVARVVRKPAVVHVLWLLVLLKLVTPPIVSIPIPVLSSAPASGTEASERADTPPELVAARDGTARKRVEGEWTEHEWPVADPLEETAVASLEASSLENTVADSGSVQDLESEPAFEPTIAAVSTESPTAQFAEPTSVVERSATKRSLVAWLVPVLVSAWAIGSIFWAATCYLRIRRFRRWLLGADPAPSNILDETRRLADRIGLRRCPEVRVIAGHIPPMALALGGRTMILLPQGLFADVTGEQLSTLLAHELAHLRRRDHWVRRLEMAAMLVYWWHPALWLARRELHRAEESCCDAWVAWLYPERARDYGEALLATLDYLADAPRAMALAASGSADAGTIRRRFEMILRGRLTRRMSWLARIAVLLIAAVVLPVTGAITAREQVPDQAASRAEGTDAEIEGLVIDAGYLGPVAVVASKDDRRLYVANADAKQIAVVDAERGKVLRSIDMPAEPTGLVLSGDGDTLYVTCAAAEGTVAVVDVKSGKPRGSIPVGHWPIGPAISPDGKTLYVCNRFDNNVAVVGLKTGKITLVPTVREPYAATITPDGKSVFVINHLPIDPADEYEVASAITVIDTATNRTQTIHMLNGSTAMRGICISPDGKYVYATHLLSRYQMPTTQVERGWMNTNALSIVDARQKKRINTVLLDDVDLGAANPWGVACSADGKTICVAHAGTHELSVIGAEGLINKLLALPEEEPPGADRSTGRGFATAVPNDLTFLTDVRQRVRLTGDSSTINGPRGLALVGSEAYVAAYFTDNLSLVDLDAKPSSVLDTIALGPGPQMSVQRRGQMLFNDATLCHQHWQSCASCHPDARVDALNWDLLNDGLGTPKNARSMLLAHKTPPSMSVGVHPTAEQSVRKLVRAVLFKVWTEEHVAAVDKYLESLQPVPSPYLVDGNLSPAAQRGKKLFFDAKINCAKCHPQPLFTDRLMHDVGSRGKYDRRDTFDTPTLIECWRTAPYMHDGRYTTVNEVLSTGKHGNQSGEIDRLSKRQIDDLAEYVLSLAIVPVTGTIRAKEPTPNRPTAPTQQGNVSHGAATAETEAGKTGPPADPAFRKKTLPTLKIRVLDKQGEPIAGASVVAYDRHHWAAGHPVDFEAISKKTGEDGWADLGTMPQDYLCVQINGRKDTFDGSYGVIHEGGAGFVLTDPHPRIEIESDDQTVTLVFTMRRGVDLDFEVIDSETGEAVHRPIIHYKDEQRKRWWRIAMIEPGGQHNFSTIVEEIGDSQLRAAARGYYPVDFRLDEKPELGKTTRQRIELKPAPDIRFMVFTPESEAARGARIKCVNPVGLESSPFSKTTTNVIGALTIPYPAQGHLARFEITHTSGQVDLWIKDLLPAQFIEEDGERKNAILCEVQLAPLPSATDTAGSTDTSETSPAEDPTPPGEGSSHRATIVDPAGQPRPAKSLHWAAQNGDVDLANRLISSGADVEAENSSRLTPLAVAAYAGHLEMVELLHAQGAKIDPKGSGNYTPLYYAASNGHADLVALLIAKGADVRRKTHLGFTPLSRAAAGGHAQTVKLLLAAGAEVNTVGNLSATPLGDAVFAGHTETVKLLIAAGADLNSGGPNHFTPLVRAASAGHMEIARLLIAAGAKADQRALYKAIMAGNRQMADLMLENGAVVPFPVLHFAAFIGDLRKVRELIEQGTDVDSRDDDEQTPLFLAALGGQRQVIEFLLGKGADIEAREEFPSTVLQKTAQRGDKDMVEFLLSKGADVNAASGEDSRTITPLGCAVRYGHHDAATVLLDHGADPDAKGRCGRTPLQWAAPRGNTEIVKLLLEHGATVDARAGDDETPSQHWTASLLPLHGAVGRDKVEVIKLLIAHGADVNSRDRNGATALHGADPNGAAILIAHGVDVNARDEKGRMPIHPAATNGDPRLVQMLIAEGVDVNAKNGNGRTPLHCGAASTRFKVSNYNPDPTAAMKVLIAAGAEVDVKANNGATALYEAATKGSTEAVELLLAEGADFNIKADEEDDKGLTLLHTAAKNFRLDIVALLIAKGADVNARTENGKTPMDLAKARTGLDADGMSYQRRTIRVLVEHGAEE